MKRIFRGAAAAMLAGASVLLAGPASAQSDSVEKLNACLAAAEQASDRRHARSTCYWEHNQRMASYGR